MSSNRSSAVAGDAVEGWHEGGWWEGYVFDTFDDCISVIFPGVSAADALWICRMLFMQRRGSWWLAWLRHLPAAAKSWQGLIADLLQPPSSMTSLTTTSCGVVSWMRMKPHFASGAHFSKSFGPQNIPRCSDRAFTLQACVGIRMSHVSIGMRDHRLP